jgi:hypothetical protein
MPENIFWAVKNWILSIEDENLFIYIFSLGSFLEGEGEGKKMKTLISFMLRFYIN